MNRRQAAGRLLTATALVMLLGGHTPYGQWVVYRKKHLVIGCHRADPRTYELAKQAVAELVEHLPAAQARVARAPDARRLASLIGTDQMEVAVLDLADARAMTAGAGQFAPYGAIPLLALAPLADRVLVARADFPERHAWLVTGALVGSGMVARLRAGENPGIPWHPGSLAQIEGRPEPDADGG
jgi:hypothetical protein